MDRYQRVEKPRAEAQVNDNEIRITALGRVRNYITYAMALLQEKGFDDIIIKAMGRAINKTVMIAELIKRRIVGLHQNTSIESIDIIDVWEPLEEGLVTIETTRHVSMIIITLSKKELNISSPGYQPPIPASQVKPLPEFEYEGEPLPSVRERGRGGRGTSRGGGNNNGVADYEDGGWDGGRGYNGRGRGRGRGGGFRGRGRGYGGGVQESGGYSEFGGPDVPVIQGRGNSNGANYADDGVWDGGRGYNGRGRGRGRVGGYRGRGRSYGGRIQESDGYNDFDGPDESAIQGRGRGRGMGRGRGRRGYRADGPVQASA